MVRERVKGSVDLGGRMSLICYSGSMMGVVV